ncbi:hypothetical protein G6R29_00365 [Fructobacillus sp. M2-14]|uniref:Sugar specific permease n=1 Tax=Fructobacillus broussonetiae TaxID=2713173 RepID=A0ABS5QZK3_9LACO|nr:hypothetical protein [Fructobacillus broussonetiae]MBS9338090.1 hypothetical protein [Fructobacillus broussonetiae]
MTKQNTISKRVLFFLIGLVLVAAGNAMTIVSGAGNGMWTASALGVGTVIHQPFALMWFALGVIVIFVNAILVKEWDWFTAVGEFFFVLFFAQLIHVFVSTFSYYQGKVHAGPMEKIGLVVLGILIVCLGTSFYQRANLWMYPTDSLTDILACRFFRGNVFLGQIVAFAPAVFIILLVALKEHELVGVQLGTILALAFNGELIDCFNKHAFTSLKHNDRFTVQRHD